MKNTVRVVILSRDRLKYLKDAIDSVLNQRLSTENIEIVVSDNSEGDAVENMIHNNYSGGDINYIRRVPAVSVLEHCRLIISETKEEYLVLFHDDDIIHPDYIRTMLPLVQQKGVSAVGCNAFLFNDDMNRAISSKPFSFKGSRVFSSGKSFLEQYIPNNSGIAAYPSHIYRTESLQQVDLNNVHRKNGFHDVLLLNSLLSFGVIVWVPDLLMYYRLHESNDGSNLYTADHISLLNKMSHSGIDKNTTAASMRFNYLFQWFVNQDVRNIFSWRNWIVFKYLFFKSFYLVSRIDLWKSLLNNRYIKNKILKWR